MLGVRRLMKRIILLSVLAFFGCNLRPYSPAERRTSSAEGELGHSAESALKTVMEKSGNWFYAGSQGGRDFFIWERTRISVMPWGQAGKTREYFSYSGVIEIPIDHIFMHTNNKSAWVSCFIRSNPPQFDLDYFNWSTK
jgi:hypothetical protein